MAEFPSGTVTFLFSDLEGSTALFERHPLAMQSVLARHDELLRAAVEGHDGHVVKFTGDGVHAVFASASCAIDAAIAVQRSMASEAWPHDIDLRVRIGVHTGESVYRDGDYFGSEVNRAARIMSVAHGGQIVCSATAAALVDDVEIIDLGEHRLRDLRSQVRLVQVIAPGLQTEFPPLRSLDAARSNLPHELSSFVGRDEEVGEVQHLLDELRLVTIVGVGGVGKTRLALRVGAEVLPRYDDGVWLCELANVRDQRDVPDAVAAALRYAPPPGVTLFEGLVAFFRNKQLLMILDNCEHLVTAVADFISIVTKEAARLAVLATSREALGLRGERAFALRSLSLPSDDSLDSVQTSEAGALFVERAHAAAGLFSLTRDNAPDVRELCTRLDGIPLALELAAARTTALSPREVLGLLDERFRLLAGHSRSAVERHQTLFAAIEWSYQLLDEVERKLLARLSVFVGDFHRDAAVTQAAEMGLDPVESVDRIASLVNKSLVERTESFGDSRYRLLETIRQYAAAQLQASGDARAARDAHASYYLRLATVLFANLTTDQDFEALERLDVESSNVSLALRWLLDTGRADEVLAFFGELPWIDSGLLTFACMDELGRIADEALEWASGPEAAGYDIAFAHAGMRAFFAGDVHRLHELATRVTSADAESVSVLQVLLSEAAIRADFEAATAMAHRAVETARSSDDPRVLAATLGLLAVAEMLLDEDAAMRHIDESVDLARRSPAKSGLVYPLFILSYVGQRRDPQRALAAAEECIRLDRTQRRMWSTVCEGLAARVRIDNGDISAGLRTWHDVLRRLDWAGEPTQLSLQLPNLSDAIAHIDPQIAVEIAAVSASQAIAQFGAFELPGYDGLAEAARRVGPDAVEHARAAAAAMSYDDAMTFVFDRIDRLIAEHDGQPNASTSASR